uniref:Peptidase S54 rhomboid domain-containing protein n=1 Tax=Oryza rufipogon TaxID=4529 RepID=A0A0E0MUS9_ORYRU
MGAGMSSGRRPSFYGGGGGGGVGRPRGMLPLLALQVLLEYGRAGASRPPVTAALLAANALLYLRPGSLDALLPSLNRVAFNPHLIIHYCDLTRFFLSAFYHLSETHFFFNMSSLLWKGIQLETSMGSVEFASMVAALLGMSQGITLLLSKGLLLFGNDEAYYDQYAVGFSGVLFGMKVVLNAWSDDYVFLHGVVIPAKYAAWAELLLIQAFIPGTSLIGHLGGILAGLAYLWLKRSFSGPDPLSLLISGIGKAVRWPVGSFSGLAVLRVTPQVEAELAVVQQERMVEVYGDAQPALMTTRRRQISVKCAAVHVRTMLFLIDSTSKLGGMGSHRLRRFAVGGSRDFPDDNRSRRVVGIMVGSRHLRASIPEVHIDRNRA